MKLITKEHYEIMEQFEKLHSYLRLDKEPKEIWEKSTIYQNGETNKLFLSFRLGYAVAKGIYQN